MGGIIDSEKVANPEFETFEPDQVIEFDDIAYENPEYRVFTFNFDVAPTDEIVRDNAICEWLNTGWHLYHEIVCSPFVMLFFSREKESE